MELSEALAVLSEYRDSILYLIARDVSMQDAERCEEALDEILSYMEEGGEKDWI